MFSRFRKILNISDPSFSEDRSHFYVITAIFNPAGYSKRYELYHRFAQHISTSGVKLITVECIFPTLGQTQFAVTSPDNPLHIQITSDSVFWMKENLLNIAVSRLPPEAKWVAWLDADISFPRKNWVDEAIKELRKYAVIQMFKKADFLGPTGKVLRTDYSFGYSVVHGKVIDQKRYDEWYPHSGYGWATSVSTFRHLGGLPDFDVVGSGDLHFAFSLLNRVTNALEDELTPEFKSYVISHSQRTHAKLQEISVQEGKSPVGYLPLRISHHWHGSRKDRQYVGRWKILIQHGFNFERDMIRRADGLLQFTPDPRNADLERDIINHFLIRKEDSKESSQADFSVTAKKKPKSKHRGVMLKPVKKRSQEDGYSSSSSSSDSDVYPPPCPVPGPCHCNPSRDNCEVCITYPCPPEHQHPCPDPTEPCPDYPEYCDNVHTSTQY